MPYPIKSQDRLMKLAEFYCSKRETSRAYLSKYLRRKCEEQKLAKNMYEKWIEPVLDACEQSKFIDDARYASILIRDYSGRGKGRRYIEQKLKEKGIASDLWQFEDEVGTEAERALKLALKSMDGLKSKVARKLQRKSDPRMNETFELKQKLMQKLVSAGFSLDVCKKAIATALTSA